VNRAVLLVSVAIAFSACEPIVAQPVLQSARNLCSESECDRYVQSSARPTCTGLGRCEVAGNPEYSYVLAISVPDGSFYAPGRTFLVRSRDFRGDLDRCPSPSCFLVPQFVEVNGAYRVGPEVGAQIGYPLVGPVSLPVRVTLFPEIVLDDGTRREAADVGLPSLPAFGEPLGPSADGATIRFQMFVPFGLYRREVHPTRPFESQFPPLVGALDVGIDGFRGAQNTFPFFSDTFAVGTPPTALDDPTGASHTALVKRAAGLDGFHTYLRDRRTERRLSSLRPLIGTEDAVRLDTLGQNGPDGALREGIDIVVTPDERWIAMPTLVDRILAGAGFRLDYPDLPAPVSVSGQVDAEGAAPGSVTLVSTRIDVSTPTSSDLTYRTVLRTDAAGRFATVLPPGNYEAFVEPDDAAFAKTRISVSVSASDRTLVLRTARRGAVSGKVRIADGRALGNAEVLWAPAVSRRSAAPAWSAPRPGRTRTDDEGRFALPLDEGDYDVTVIPAPGTGFPRFVAPRRPVGPNDATLDDFVVPAPTRVSLSMKSPDGQAIARAVVRAFAYVASGGTYVEVGQTMSDTAGQFELLLGPLPK